VGRASRPSLAGKDGRDAHPTLLGNFEQRPANATLLEWPELVQHDANDPQPTHHVGRIKDYGDRALRVVPNSQANPVRIVTAYFDRKMKGRL
jgi:hypothetical protein